MITCKLFRFFKHFDRMYVFVIRSIEAISSTYLIQKPSESIDLTALRIFIIIALSNILSRITEKGNRKA